MKYLLICVIFLNFSFSVAEKCPGSEKFYLLIDEYSSLDDNKEIILKMHRLIKAYKKCGYPEDSVYAKAFHILGRSLWYDNQLDSAIMVIKKSIEINSHKVAWVSTANLCNSYYNLGWVYNAKGDMKMAVNSLSKSIQIAKRFPEKTIVVALAYIDLARLNFSLGDYEKTIQYADYGYNLSKKLRLNESIAASLVEKAQALIQLGRIGESEVLLSEAIKIVEVDDVKGAIFSLLAEVNSIKKNHDQVISFYKKSFNSFLAANYTYGCAQAANNLADYYQHSLSNIPEALVNYNLALKYMDTPVGKGVIYNSISEAYLDNGDLKKGLAYNHMAMQSAIPRFLNSNTSSNPPAFEIKAEINQTALLSIIQTKADIWLKIAITKKQNKAELRNALNTYMLADTLVDYMRWEHSGAVSKLFWRDKTRSLYENAIEACYLLNDPEKAFYFFEKSRAVLLNDQLNELAANKMLSPEDLKKENQHQKDILDIQNKLSEGDTPELREKLFVALRAQESFVESLEQRNPRYYAYKYDNRVPKLKDFSKNELEDKQVFLSYFIGDKGVYSMLISKKGSSIRKIDLADYEKALTDFEKLVGDQEGQNQHFDRFLSSASELYRLLIKPLAIPAGSRIIISPDGDFLPYGALSKSATTPQYLIRDYAFSYAYSARSLAKRVKRSDPIFSSHTFLGFAPVNFSPKLAQASLPGSEEALDIINGHFSFSKLLTGQEASRKSFLEKAPDYRIVQVLTHAKAGNTDVAPTLYFADSTIKLSELSSIQNAQTELMVLSACETGIGKVQNGEGVFSLARGFAGLGIPSAVTTLWSLENQSVYELTQSFYDGLDEGNDLDIAIQKAQLKWLDSGSKGKQLPYYWAGILVVGNTEPIHTGNSMALIYIFAGIVLSAIVIYILSRRIRSARLRGETLSLHLPASSVAKIFTFLFP